MVAATLLGRTTRPPQMGGSFAPFYCGIQKLGGRIAAVRVNVRGKGGFQHACNFAQWHPMVL